MKLDITFDDGKTVTVNDTAIPNQIKKKLRKEFQKLTIERKVITEPVSVYERNGNV